MGVRPLKSRHSTNASWSSRAARQSSQPVTACRAHRGQSGKKHSSSSGWGLGAGLLAGSKNYFQESVIMSTVILVSGISSYISDSQNSRSQS